MAFHFLLQNRQYPTQMGNVSRGIQIPERDQKEIPDCSRLPLMGLLVDCMIEENISDLENINKKS